MRKPFFIAGVLLALAAAPYSFAQKQVLPNHFGNWSGQPSTTAVHTTNPNFAALEEEAGLSASESVDYLSGASKLYVDLKRYRDPSSAYEIYTASIWPEMHPSTLGRTSAIDGERLIALLGNYVLELQPTPAISDADLSMLVKTVSGRADQTPLPPIRAYLPAGFSDGTQKYARGPAGFRSATSTLKQDEFANLADQAGFNSSAEAIFAEYRDGKEVAVLLLIEYPTPQLAEQHLRHLVQALSPAAKQSGTTIERKGSILTLVLNPSSVAYGSSLRSAVNYETAVTWNEPHQTITDPPILTTLSKIFIGTGVFMVVAVVLGLAFGGVRVMAKIFFPGKFFDRPEQMEVLQLGLSGKRIDPRDFY